MNQILLAIFIVAGIGLIAGLGLAIVKHVMRRAGGELSIESTPGEGSKFMLRFPEERIFSGRYL